MALCGLVIQKSMANMYPCVYIKDNATGFVIIVIIICTEITRHQFLVVITIVMLKVEKKATRAR
jgi:hypothetical protein